MKRLILFVAAVLGALCGEASAQSTTRLCYGQPCIVVDTTHPLPVTGSSGGPIVVDGNVSNATSGVATSATNVPTVAYNYVWNGTTWDQWSSLTLGSKHAATTAIVDASGNQITTFGGAATTSNASSGVAASSTNQANVVWNYVWNGATWDQATGLVVGTAGAPSTQVVSVQGVASGTPITTQGPSTGGGFPTSSTPITISATGTTGTVAAALAAAASKTTYICGFSITSDAVAGLSGNATVAGVITGTMTYIQGVGVAPAVVSTTQNFNPCVPSSTTNTAITVTSAAAGTGGTTAVNAWGYQQ